MARMRYVVTGGTGFIGRRVVSRILAPRPDDGRGVGAGAPRVARHGSSGSPPSGVTGCKPLVGDLTAPDLGLTDDAVAELGAVDHVVHCAAIYDITADDGPRSAPPTSTAPAR